MEKRQPSNSKTSDLKGALDLQTQYQVATRSSDETQLFEVLDQRNLKQRNLE